MKTKPKKKRARVRKPYLRCYGDLRMYIDGIYLFFRDKDFHYLAGLRSDQCRKLALRLNQAADYLEQGEK